MSIDRIVLAVAGFFIVLSLALGWHASPVFVHEYWLFFTAFVGFNLLQSAPTHAPLGHLGRRGDPGRGGDAGAGVARATRHVLRPDPDRSV